MESSDWPLIEECSKLVSELLESFAGRQESELLSEILLRFTSNSSSSLSRVELLSCLAGNRIRNEHPDGSFKTMTVSYLREQLESFGLDVDGTRGMLVKRLSDRQSGSLN